MSRTNSDPHAPVVLTPCADYSDDAVKAALNAVLEPIGGLDWVTEGMTASALLQMMGSRVQRTALVDAELYCWTLTDGRVFCALAEGDVTDPLQTERVVTYTFYRASMEDVAVPSAENTNAVTEGMSFATVCALLGTEIENSLSKYNPTGEWWSAEIEFEVVTHLKTNRKRAYVVSVISYYQ